MVRARVSTQLKITKPSPLSLVRYKAKMKTTIAILTILLLASNVCWFCQVVDTGVTLSYRDQQTYELEETRKQLMATFPAVANKSTRDEIVGAASNFTDQEVFEKDGCTWVGWIGFKFDENNKLKSVSPSWSYGDNDPCYQPYNPYQAPIRQGRNRPVSEKD